MGKLFLTFNGVSFAYENSANNIFNKISFRLSAGWTGLIGTNGSGKTTLLKLTCGLLHCIEGTVKAPYKIHYCEQRTDSMPDVFVELLQSYDKKTFKLLKELEIEYEWIKRWSTLSHGERKRVQIACALWSCPDLLAIDEPTNHLDMNVKELIRESLKQFKGIGVIVSHDRNLLDNLCETFLFIDNRNVDFRRGKLSYVIAQRKSENDYSLKQLELKRFELDKLKNEYKRRSEIVEKAKKKSSKRFINKKDHDAKAKINLGRLTGKDAVGGKLKTEMQKRLENKKFEIQRIEVKREYNIGIILSGSVSQRNYLLSLESDSLQLSEDKKLVFENLEINPQDKFALTGRNGSGKSSLIRYILKYINANSDNITYIPQEISIDETKAMMSEIKKLPNQQLGKLLIIVSRLGSDAKRILETEIPSPGETRKLLLGLGITKDPHLIIMDEPTNHMDLVSIECLEDALQNVSCALLLVSHDKKFLDILTNKEWKIIKTENGFKLVTTLK